MPRYDFKCPKCEATRSDVYVNSFATDPTDVVRCAQCQYPMEKLPAAPSFTIKGFSAKNGYSKEAL